MTVGKYERPGNVKIRIAKINAEVAKLVQTAPSKPSKKKGK